ncbi:MAG: alpha/beta fold hydrolase [Burkholderiaceae bacterium]
MTDRQPGWQQTAARISDRPHEREHALRWLARAARERGFAACRWLAGLALALSATAALAAGLPAAKEGDWTARDFRFRSGDVLPELRLHYTTVGDPGGIPVLVLHGTGGSGKGLLSAEFGEELFGPGQPLDAARYYVILPDSIGHGASTKPSDGLRARFPRYNYDDMVEAQYRLVTEGMGIKHLRLVIGVSMGGMPTWSWGTRYPDFMDVLVPMSSQPTPMASRNWMLRRLITDTIRNDPEWNNGNYSTQPRSVQAATVFYGIATNGGTLALQRQAPTREAADKLLVARLSAPFRADANDLLYQWDSSRDYDPSPGLEKITAKLLAINSADDERNPPETGIMERELKRVKNGRLFLIPASDQTRGHGTVSVARLWKHELPPLLETASPRTP